MSGINNDAFLEEFKVLKSNRENQNRRWQISFQLKHASLKEKQPLKQRQRKASKNPISTKTLIINDYLRYIEFILVIK